MGNRKTIPLSLKRKEELGCMVDEEEDSKEKRRKKKESRKIAKGTGGG